MTVDIDWGNSKLKEKTEQVFPRLDISQSKSILSLSKDSLNRLSNQKIRKSKSFELQKKELILFFSDVIWILFKRFFPRNLKLWELRWEQTLFENNLLWISILQRKIQRKKCSLIPSSANAFPTTTSTTTTTKIKQIQLQWWLSDPGLVRCPFKSVQSGEWPTREKAAAAAASAGSAPASSGASSSPRSASSRLQNW